MPLAVATLLANSVINMVRTTIVAASRIVGTLPSGASTAPSQAARPLAVIEAASASPPPNIMMTPHGARRTAEHTSERQPLMRTTYASLCLHKKTRQVLNEQRQSSSHQHIE